MFLYKTESRGTIGGGRSWDELRQQCLQRHQQHRHLTDFVAGTDKLAFVVNDGYDAVKAAGRCRPSGWQLNAGGHRRGAGHRGHHPEGCGVGRTVNDADDYALDFAGAPAGPADLILRVNATGGGDDRCFGGLVGDAAERGIGGRVDLVYGGQPVAGGAFDQVIRDR